MKYIVFISGDTDILPLKKYIIWNINEKCIELVMGYILIDYVHYYGNEDINIWMGGGDCIISCSYSDDNIYWVQENVFAFIGTSNCTYAWYNGYGYKTLASAYILPNKDDDYKVSFSDFILRVALDVA